MLPEVFLETTYIVILCVVEYLMSWLCLRMKKKNNKKGNKEITTTTRQTVRYTCLTYLYLFAFNFLFHLLSPARKNSTNLSLSIFPLLVATLKPLE